MIIGMGLRIDIEREREVPIPLETSALVVAFKCLGVIALVGLGSETFCLLFKVLARACDECFALAWLIFLTRRRSMAELLTRVPTGLLRFAAELAA